MPAILPVGFLVRSRYHRLPRSDEGLVLVQGDGLEPCAGAAA